MDMDVLHQAETINDLVEYQSGSIVSKVLAKHDHGSVTLFAFSSGQELSEHTAPFDALVEMTEGEAEILINHESHNLKQGQMIRLPANRPHAIKALTDFKMLLVMIKD